MEIHGFQKMTMLDYPERVACTIFTAGCNFRCPFCHNALLVTEIEGSGIYREEEVLSYLEKRKTVLDGVCITGGEPLLNRDIGDLIRKIKAMGYLVKVDTNGSFPDRLEALVNEGIVDYVAMDIKNSPERYAETIGVANFDLTPIQKSISFLLEGRVPYEFRTTVVKEFHTPKDIETIGKWIAGAPKYFLQNFKESDHMIGSNLHAHEESVLEEMRQKASKYVPTTALRGV